MKKTQSVKLNALLAVQVLLLANPTLVAVLAALQEALESLTDFITDINLNVKIQSSPSGTAEAKASALTALGDAAFGVAGAVLSFAEKTGDLTLAGRVKYSRSEVTAGSSNAVVARCQHIIDAATENVSSLGDYGVTAAKLTALKQKLKTYDTLRAMPRQAKAATKQLERLFPDADRLLENRIDRLMWQFRESQPEFYDKYLVARAVLNAPTISAEEKPKAAAAAEGASASTSVTGTTTDAKATADVASPAAAPTTKAA